MNKTKKELIEDLKEAVSYSNHLESRNKQLQKRLNGALSDHNSTIGRWNKTIREKNQLKRNIGDSMFLILALCIVLYIALVILISF